MHIKKEHTPCGVPLSVAAVRPELLRPYGRPSDSFSSLWAAFMLTVHINALYNESVHGNEEHAT